MRSHLVTFCLLPQYGTKVCFPVSVRLKVSVAVCVGKVYFSFGNKSRDNMARVFSTTLVTKVRTTVLGYLLPLWIQQLGQTSLNLTRLLDQPAGKAPKCGSEPSLWSCPPGSVSTLQSKQRQQRLQPLLRYFPSVETHPSGTTAIY